MRNGMSFVSKWLPDIKNVVNEPGFRTVNGVRARYQAYDSTTEYMHERHYGSTVTPDFHRLAGSQLPVNTFYAYTGVVTDSYGVIRDSPSYTSNPVVYEGNSRMVAGWSHQALLSCYNSFAISDIGTSSALRAEQKALKLMSNMKFNAAQAFAERKQSADLLIKSVNRFITVAVAFKRGRFSKVNDVLKSRNYPPLHPVARKRQDEAFGPLVRNPEVGDLIRAPGPKSFPNLWLEYSYGWRPLLNDIYGAAELLAQVHTQSRPHWVTSTDKASRLYVGSNSSEGVIASASGEANVKSRCQIGFDVSSSFLDGLKSTGISNPALLAWELLPYSFVIDWFIPVGGFLERLNATSGLTFIKGSTSILTEYEASSSASSNGSRWSLASPMTMKYKLVQLHRKKLTSFPGAEPPGLRLGLGLTQVTSGLALLSQIFNRR